MGKKGDTWNTLVSAGTCVGVAWAGQALLGDPFTPLGLIAGYKASGGKLTGVALGGALGAAAQTARGLPVLGAVGLGNAPIGWSWRKDPNLINPQTNVKGEILELRRASGEQMGAVARNLDNTYAWYTQPGGKPAGVAPTINEAKAGLVRAVAG
jgi:hypothetical protein